MRISDWSSDVCSSDLAPVEDPGIPVSFSGNRAAFGFALFSLFSVSSLAIRQLFLLASQLRRESWRADPDVGLYRLTVASLMMAIVHGAAPDVMLLLLYGEAHDPPGERKLVVWARGGWLCGEL